METEHSWDMFATLSDMCATWREDLFHNVIPFWLSHSIDLTNGGYFTALDRDGSILDDTKFVWLQGRAVYMWSRLHNECGAECGPDAANKWFDAALCGARFLERAKHKDSGLLLFSVSRDGTTPLHMQRKPYAAVFHVLGCLEFGDAIRRRQAAGFDVMGEDATTYLQVDAALLMCCASAHPRPLPGRPLARSFDHRYPPP